MQKIVRDLFRIDRIAYPAADLLTVAHDNDRSYLYNGRYYSPLIDTIEDDVRAEGAQTTSVARIISTIKGERAYGDVHSPEGAFARALVQKRLTAVLNRGAYPYSKPEEKVWAAILDATGARSVVAIQPSRELCKVCRERGIWVADMQHGVIAERHPWYGAQFRAKDPVEQLPNAILCWDQGSAEVIRQWAGPQIETPVIGNPWLSRFMRQRPGDALVGDAQANAPLERADDRKSVLVSLSWGERDIANGFIHEELEAAIIATSGRLRWLVRLHPNQQIGFATPEGPKFVRYFNERLKGNVEWEWPTKVPLPYLLSRVDAHVSWNSSVSIEAALCGLSTGLLSPHLWPGEALNDYYSYFRSTGEIQLVPLQRQEIAAWVENAVKIGRRPQRTDASETQYRAIVSKLAGIKQISAEL
ncbi:hypothetical protein [Devosia limi]|uniref:hypothetical protein n=1 Tax=Devosia limi TaxID=288995 RepID=UPI0011604E05|nr:hypothetical protein [Devosia limi]